jgi:hypothetical protein
MKKRISNLFSVLYRYIQRSYLRKRNSTKKRMRALNVCFTDYAKISLLFFDKEIVCIKNTNIIV